MASRTPPSQPTLEPIQARVAAIERLPMERVTAGADTPFWRGFGRAVREVYEYRELLLNLIRKELKTRYKDSFLGFLWSLLRPMFLLAVYYIAIGKFLGVPFPLFPIFLFCGLVAWTLFTDVLGGCTGSVVGNAGLIKKVYFPRELLPLSVVGPPWSTSPCSCWCWWPPCSSSGASCTASSRGCCPWPWLPCCRS